MMTKKREMAEWILDFFRRAKVDASQTIMMRNVQNKILELNPKERDMYVPVINELIKNGYFTYEEGSPQVLRLTEKGRDYIYDPSAELDCCYDSQKLTPAQTQYLAYWHDSFVQYVERIKHFISALMVRPEVTENDIRGLAKCVEILGSPDVNEIEKSLSQGSVSRDVLNKIAKLNKDLVDVAVDQLQTDNLVKEFLRTMTYLKIENDKAAEGKRLQTLRIPLND